MGPRPFPLPLSIGTDICQISRIYSILAGSRGARFVSRVLAPEELAAARLVRPAVAALLARTPAPTGREREGSTGPSREGRDVELWGAATFVAGR